MIGGQSGCEEMSWCLLLWCCCLGCCRGCCRTWVDASTPTLALFLSSSPPLPSLLPPISAPPPSPPSLRPVHASRRPSRHPTSLMLVTVFQPTTLNCCASVLAHHHHQHQGWRLQRSLDAGKICRRPTWTTTMNSSWKTANRSTNLSPTSALASTACPSKK